jgi:hypothetical protein
MNTLLLIGFVFVICLIVWITKKKPGVVRRDSGSSDHPLTKAARSAAIGGQFLDRDREAREEHEDWEFEQFHEDDGDQDDDQDDD